SARCPAAPSAASKPSDSSLDDQRITVCGPTQFARKPIHSSPFPAKLNTCGGPQTPTNQASQSSSRPTLSAFLDRPKARTEASTGWPTLTGQFGRSRTAILADPQRPNWPATLYKNTHIQILISKNTQRNSFYKVKRSK